MGKRFIEYAYFNRWLVFSFKTSDRLSVFFLFRNKSPARSQQNCNDACTVHTRLTGVGYTGQGTYQCGDEWRESVGREHFIIMNIVVAANGKVWRPVRRKSPYTHAGVPLRAWRDVRTRLGLGTHSGRLDGSRESPQHALLDVKNKYRGGAPGRVGRRGDREPPAACIHPTGKISPPPPIAVLVSQTFRPRIFIYTRVWTGYGGEGTLIVLSIGVFYSTE